MKHVNFFLAVIAFAIFLSLNAFTQDHSENKIGELQGDKLVVTCNQDQLFSELEALVNATLDASVRFDKLSIEEGDGYYYLLAVDKDNNIKTARELVLQNGDFYEFSPEETGGSQTITCSGCSIGCNPQKLNGNWACYPSCSTSTCIKTVTITITEPDQE